MLLNNRMLLLQLCVILCNVVAIPLQSQEFPNDNLEILGHTLPGGGGAYSDVWGYAADGREYCLIGSHNGTYVLDVTDPKDIREIAFFEGAGSKWRDIKTHGHYAYITHDENTNDFLTPGMQIIDLSNLPEEATLAGNYFDNLPRGYAHNLYIDNGIAYVAGGREARGALILDLSDPLEPQKINAIIEPYFHDIIVNDNIIFGSAIQDGELHILDGTDLNDIKTLSVTPYPGAFPHNIWMTDDNQYFISTNERHGLPINFWDARDLSEPVQIASYSAGPNSVPHNAHIMGDFAYVSYYNDGLKIIDISNRKIPIEVGNFDSFPDDSLRRNRGLTGNWGAYPFLPSGNILISDTKYGLYILGFNGARAGFLEGRLLDANTERPLSNVTIEFTDSPVHEGVSSTNLQQNDGVYAIGSKPRRRSIRFSKFGYHSMVLENFEFQVGHTAIRDIRLDPVGITAVQIQVLTTAGETVPNAPVHISTADGTFERDIATGVDGAGNVALFVGEYVFRVNMWGFLPEEVRVKFDAETTEKLVIELTAGYAANFAHPHPDWILKDPDEQSPNNRWHFLPVNAHNLNPFLPLVNRHGDTSSYVAVSSIRRGNARLESPIFNGERLEKATLAFYHFYNPIGYEQDKVDVKDTLLIELSVDDGATWHSAQALIAADTAWTYTTINLENIAGSSPHMKLRFHNIEGPDSASRKKAYCLLDEIRIIPEALAVGVEEIAHRHITADELHFPNPTFGSLAIEWRQPAAQRADIMVFSLTGNRVAYFTYPAGVGKNVASIDLGGLPAGVYFYRIIAGEFVSSARKVELIK